MLPLLNIAAAAGIMRAYQNRRKGAGWAGVWLAVVALLACSAAASVLMTLVSRANYPGGHALARLHATEAASAAEAARAGTVIVAELHSCSDVIVVQQSVHLLISYSPRHICSFLLDKNVACLPAGRNLTVHIDVLAAMTGVSRFGEAGKPWLYSKVRCCGQARQSGPLKDSWRSDQRQAWPQYNLQ